MTAGCFGGLCIRRNGRLLTSVGVGEAFLSGYLGRIQHTGRIIQHKRVLVRSLAVGKKLSMVGLYLTEA